MKKLFLIILLIFCVSFDVFGTEYTIYPTSNDGMIYTNDTGWATTRDKATGTVYNSNATANVRAATFASPPASGSAYYMDRGFLDFDLSSYDGMILSAKLYLYGYVAIAGDKGVYALQGSQSTSLATGDFDSFTRTSFGSVTWASGQYNIITFNSAGETAVSDAFGGTLKICLQSAADFENDYSKASLGSNTFYCTEQSGTSQDPKLVIDILPDDIGFEPNDYPEDEAIFGLNPANWTDGDVLISGYYTGTVPTHVEARVYDFGSYSSTVQINSQNWNQLTSETIADNYWQGTLNDIPKGGWYGIEVRKSNATSETADKGTQFSIGYLIITAGQSFIDFWFDWYPDETFTKDTPNDLTRKWRYSTSGQYDHNQTDAPDYTGWETITGDGGIVFANDFASGFGTGNNPVGILDYGMAGSALLEAHEYLSFGWWVGSSDPTNWLEVLTNEIDYIDPLYGGDRVSAILFSQGWSDAGKCASAGDCNTLETDYYTGLGTLGTALVGITRSSVPILIRTLAKTPDGAIVVMDDTTVTSVREAQRKRVDASVSDNYYMSATVFDLALSDEDNLHFGEESQETEATRIAHSCASILGIPGADSWWRGPRPTSWYPQDTETTDIHITHGGGTDFTPTTAITGFQVYTGSWISATGVRQDAETVRLTHATGTVTNVRYGYGIEPAVNLVDNTSLSLPLEPRMDIPRKSSPMILRWGLD